MKNISDIIALILITVVPVYMGIKLLNHLDAYYKNYNIVSHINININIYMIISLILIVLGGNFTKAAATVALDAIGVAIASSIELGTAGLGTLFAGAFLLAWGGVASTIAGVAATYGINALKGRTFSVSNYFFPTKTITI